MNILFLTIGRFAKMEDHGIYNDLLRAFMKNGHTVYSVSAYEKRYGLPTTLEKGENYFSLHVKTGNLTESGTIEKGLAMLSLGSRYKKAADKYFSGVKFDLILYSTPPITLAGAVKTLKKKTGAKTYLLLKDIFPQNAVDLGMMSAGGAMGFLYRHFKKQEKELYAISDMIGCMSQANIDFLLKNNPELPPEKVELSPNSIEVCDVSVTPEQHDDIRRKYGIPLDKKVFVYGGNLGKPQGIPFLIDCLKAEKANKDAFFLIVGFGTEYGAIKEFCDVEKPANVKLIKGLPHDDYEKMIAACDVGLIFLDHRFTIPNFPSRLLAYMQARLPVIACTDPNSDVGDVAAEGGFGWKCESNSVEAFRNAVNQALASDLKEMGDRGYEYLLEHYTVDRQYAEMMKSIGCDES